MRATRVRAFGIDGGLEVRRSASGDHEFPIASSTAVLLVADCADAGGATSPLPLVSPNLAPATITRLKDGNLVAVWNDYSRKPADADSQSFAERREPFSVAWSKDDGRTWSPSRTIEADPSAGVRARSLPSGGMKRGDPDARPADLI